MSRPSDFEGELHLFNLMVGGKQNPVFSGYMPLHKVYDDYLTSGKHEYPVKHCVAPGETATALVWLITPEVYPGCLWIGRELDVLEGSSNVVGKLTVSKIFNEILAGSAESHMPHCIEKNF